MVVALLGDAAQAMTPNLGQGACQAIEDAVTLGACLDTTTDTIAALNGYDRLRRRLDPGGRSSLRPPRSCRAVVVADRGVHPRPRRQVGPGLRGTAFCRAGPRLGSARHDRFRAYRKCDVLMPDWTYQPLRGIAAALLGTRRSQVAALRALALAGSLPGGGRLIALGFGHRHPPPQLAGSVSGVAVTARLGAVVPPTVAGDTARALPLLGAGLVVVSPVGMADVPVVCATLPLSGVCRWWFTRPGRTPRPWRPRCRRTSTRCEPGCTLS
jgi:hypothetical protein